MNEEYIKKLEDVNKRLEEALGKYIDRYGELKPIVEFPTNPNDTVAFGPLSGISMSNVAQSHTFVAQSPNGNMITINDSGIVFKGNVTFDCPSVNSTVESEALKQIKEVKIMLQVANRKPKPRFKRYCRVALKKLKRKFK
jgi:hypothetical protein